jgi:hypothetical protein
LRCAIPSGTLVDHPLKRLVQRLLRARAAEEMRQRQPAWQHRVHALREVAEDVEETVPEALAEVAPEEAADRDVHDQGAEGMHQLELALDSEGRHEPLNLLEHHRDVGAELRALEHRHHELPLLLVLVLVGQEVEPITEHSREEGVPGADRQALIGLAEEQLVQLGSKDHGHPLAAELEPEHVPVLAVAALKQPERLPQERQPVSDEGEAPPAYDGRGGHLHRG